MGAWIEIVAGEKHSAYLMVAPHDGCVDWNPLHIALTYPLLASHPTMGAWIEIVQSFIQVIEYQVAPHDGCVDWNLCKSLHCNPCESVAPHDGCVDWNSSTTCWVLLCWRRTPRWVRGLKSVSMNDFDILFWSHPTMGAWIEISAWTLEDLVRIRRTPRWVRGLKSNKYIPTILAVMSHPTMGAWIEIALS